MDLSNLSSNLPPSRPVTDSQLRDLDSEVTREFKNAANSVASLYRLSNQKNQMYRHKGYLDCLDDVLNMIRLHKIKHGERDNPRRRDYDELDLENWALTKKAELMGGENINRGLIFNEAVPEPESEDNSEPPKADNLDFKFSMPKKLAKVAKTKSEEELEEDEENDEEIEYVMRENIGGAGVKRACVAPFHESKRQNQGP